MAKILSLFDPVEEVSREQGLYVVFSSSCSGKELFAVSPKTMHLGANLYVSDIGYVRSYWENISNRTSLEKSVCQALRIESSQLLVFCQHPFEGLLLFQWFQSRSLTGVFQSQQKFVRRIYQNIPWSFWLKSVFLLEDCFQKNHVFSSERKIFKKKSKQLERFLSRMSFRTLGDAKELDSLEIRRRFGVFIGFLWSWTYETLSSNKEGLISFGLRRFPWISIQGKDVFMTRRALDFPTLDWSIVRVCLAEDLQFFERFFKNLKFCQMKGFRWILHFENLESKKLEFYFKSPVSYKKEFEEEFGLTLRQFSFAFESLRNEFSKNLGPLGFDETPFAVAWDLELLGVGPIEEAHSAALFSSYQKSVEVREKLERMQNLVSGDFHVYSLEKNFVCGKDYSRVLSFMDSEKRVLKNKGERKMSFKPFFIYSEPVPVKRSRFIRIRFLERTSSSWWSSKGLLKNCRDYFLAEDKNSSFFWVFRDEFGKWFIHGIYS